MKVIEFLRNCDALSLKLIISEIVSFLALAFCIINPHLFFGNLEGGDK